MERPLHFRPLTALNRWFARVVMQMSATQNVPGEPVGALNRAFGQFYKLRLKSKAFKQRNRKGYYTLKWAAIGGAVLLIIW